MFSCNIHGRKEKFAFLERERERERERKRVQQYILTYAFVNIGARVDLSAIFCTCTQNQSTEICTADSGCSLAFLKIQFWIPFIIVYSAVTLK